MAVPLIFHVPAQLKSMLLPTIQLLWVSAKRVSSDRFLKKRSQFSGRNMDTGGKKGKQGDENTGKMTRFSTLVVIWGQRGA